MCSLIGRRKTGFSVLRHAVGSWLSKLTDSSTPLLPFIPKPIKLILLLLVLINSPSFPFVWHIRVWYYPLAAYFKVYTKGRKQYLADWEAASQKQGGIWLKTKVHRIAWIDDCDYNLHMSNSCYAKNVDASRMKWCIDAMAPLFTPQAYMALGASHYVFLKEIPMGSRYTVETRIGGWGEKWMYLISEFVMYPKKASGKGKGKAVEAAAAAKEATKDKVGAVIPSISATPSGEATPIEAGPNATLESVKKAATIRNRAPRADGGVTATIVVTEYCVKAGRVTVPPRIALYFAEIAGSKETRDSARKVLFANKDFGFKWLRGGWKEEPDADTIGLDIGRPAEQTSGAAQWVEEGEAAMQKVNEGLAVF